MSYLSKVVAKYLRDVANKIDSGNCNVTEEQAMEILSVVANEQLSKDLACSFLNISRSKFDELVRQGKIPKGRKVRGFKELMFNKKDLIGIK